MIPIENQLENMKREYGKLLLMLQDKFPDVYEYYLSNLIPTLPSPNNDFKKPCPQCNGNKKLRSLHPPYDYLSCPKCDGQGFIKS